MRGEGDLAGPRGEPPLTSEIRLAVWCGARNGRVATTRGRFPSSPATLWIFVTSSASAVVVRGRIEGSRRASIVFPQPGGPTSTTLWPPAAAISSARFASVCPRTLVDQNKTGRGEGCRQGRDQTGAIDHPVSGALFERPRAEFALPLHVECVSSH